MSETGCFIEAADALHDSADIGEDLWHRLAGLFREEQLLDLLMLAGWYHAISFTANGARVACEDGAPRFTDVQRPPGWPLPATRTTPPPWRRSTSATSCGYPRT